MIFKSNYGLIINKIFVSNKCVHRFVQQRHQLISEKSIHRISLDVCRPLYAGQHKKWYLRYGPKTGLNLNVEVVDTKPDAVNCSTLVALHGCPGTHLDFTKLVQHFGPKYRVIVPNFPDFSVTKATNHFWHSAKEKAQYVRDVLKVLDIHQIDCLIAHSSAIFPASYLWLKEEENKDFIINSLCLLSNPGPKWFNKKTLRRTSMFVQMSRIPAIRDFLTRVWSRKLSRRLGIVNQIDRYDDLALLLSTYVHSDTETVEDRLRRLKELKIPTLAVFSSKDKLFKEEIFYDLYHKLDVKYEDYEIFEEHQDFLVQKSSDDNWIKVVNIPSGGHYVFSTHSVLVHKYIEDLLNKVIK